MAGDVAIKSDALHDSIMPSTDFVSSLVHVSELNGLNDRGSGNHPKQLPIIRSYRVTGTEKNGHGAHNVRRRLASSNAAIR